MTRPTKRRDCGTLQFERRTPRALLLAGKRGERIPFRFPDPAGDFEGSARIGAVVIKVSLRTHDPYVAKLRCAILNEAIDRYTRAVVAGPRRLTNRGVVALAGDLYRRMIGSWEDDPEGAGWWRALEHGLESLRDADVTVLRRTLGERADQALSERGWIVDEDSRDRLLVAIREADRLGAALLAKRADGDYSPDPNASRFPALPDSSPNASLALLVEAWKAEAAAVGTAESTVTKYERILLRFAKFLGHDDARAVTAEDVVRFKDHRLREERASAKTIKDGDLAALKSVFSWAVDNKKLSANPAAGVTIKVVKTRKRGYSNDGATAILRAALSRKTGPQERPKLTAALRWAPLVARSPRTGARRCCARRTGRSG